MVACTRRIAPAAHGTKAPALAPHESATLLGACHLRKHGHWESIVSGPPDGRVSLLRPAGTKGGTVDRKSVISQLSTVSEAALGKLAQSDLSKAALQGALTLKEKVERLMSSMTDLDGRVADLEKRVAALEKKAKAVTSTAGSAKKATTTAAKKKPAGSSKSSTSAGKSAAT
jgi:hypothetical protein